MLKEPTELKSCSPEPEAECLHYLTPAELAALDALLAPTHSDLLDTIPLSVGIVILNAAFGEFNERWDERAGPEIDIPSLQIPADLKVLVLEALLNNGKGWQGPSDWPLPQETAANASTFASTFAQDAATLDLWRM
jgi:hypothetical protein